MIHRLCSTVVHTVNNNHVEFCSVYLIVSILMNIILYHERYYICFFYRSIVKCCNKLERIYSVVISSTMLYQI